MNVIWVSASQLCETLSYFELTFVMIRIADAMELWQSAILLRKADADAAELLGLSLFFIQARYFSLFFMW